MASSSVGGGVLFLCSFLIAGYGVYEVAVLKVEALLELHGGQPGCHLTPSRSLLSEEVEVALSSSFSKLVRSLELGQRQRTEANTVPGGGQGPYLETTTSAGQPAPSTNRGDQRCSWRTPRWREGGRPAAMALCGGGPASLSCISLRTHRCEVVRQPWRL